MALNKDGEIGERKLFEFLKDKGFRCFQADAIALINDEYWLFEVKCQERFTSPPIDGHGLPAYQVKSRLDFQKATGVIACFIVFDKETNEIFAQRFDKLEKGYFFDTNGLKKRRIYPLTSFKKIK